MEIGTTQRLIAAHIFPMYLTEWNIINMTLSATTIGEVKSIEQFIISRLPNTLNCTIYDGQ